MTPRAIGTIARTVVVVVAAAVFGALSFAGAAGAQAPVKPSPKPTKPPVVFTITITGPDVSPPIVIRSTEDPTLYAQVNTQVSWMKSATGNVMPSMPTQLGPDYTVTLTTGNTKTAVYDLYPLVATGPRAHRAAIGGQKAAWFFAPVSMASGLEAAGVTFPTSSASGEAAPPTVATIPPSTSLSKIMSQSKLALGLAALAAAAVLLTLALAARRSRRLDRRRAMPAAIARLETVANRARGGTGLGAAALATSGAGLRRSVPAARAEAGSRVTGTARVPAPGQPTSATSSARSGSVATGRATGTAAPIPPRDSAAPSSPGPSSPPSGPSSSPPAGPGSAGSPTGGSAAPGGTVHGTPRSDQRASEPTHRGPATSDRPRTDPRPPAPRAAADAPLDVPVAVPTGTPAEVAVGTAQVIAASVGMAPTPATTPVTDAADEAVRDERAVGTAPAPRAPADDIVEPAIGRTDVVPEETATPESAPTARATETPTAQPVIGTDRSTATESADAVTDTTDPDAVKSDAVEVESDAADPDTALADAVEPDAADPDTAEPDAAAPDEAATTTPDKDTALADAAEPDAADPDTAEPDAAAPDEAATTTPDKDTALADAAEPDAADSDGDESALPPVETSDDAQMPADDVTTVATSPAIESSSDADSAEQRGAGDSPESADAVLAESDLDHDAAASGSERTGQRP